MHTDAKAAESARVVNARAFTVGEDIFFASEMDSPQKSVGKCLLAHELAHVVQNHLGRSEKSGRSIQISHPTNPLEQEADAVANRVAIGKKAGLEVQAGSILTGRGSNPKSLLQRALISEEEKSDAIASNKDEAPQELAEEGPRCPRGTVPEEPYQYSSGVAEGVLFYCKCCNPRQLKSECTDKGNQALMDCIAELRSRNPNPKPEEKIDWDIKCERRRRYYRSFL